MRILKLALISAVLLFALITGIASLLPSEIRISRAIDINAPASEVKAALLNLNGYAKWNEFVRPIEDDTITANTLRSKSLILILQPPKGNDISSQWQQPGHPSLPAVYSVFDGKQFVTVQWFFVCRFRWYPWEKFSSMIYDKQLGTPMEQSLKNLKTSLERKPM